MKRILLFMFFAGISVFVSSCSLLVTRTEEDIFTITEVDTTQKHYNYNSPSNKDRGVIFPSDREILSERYMVQRDSVVAREYPDFIRLGLFEGVGIIGGNTDHGLGLGIYGIHPDLGNLNDKYRGEKNFLTGGLYRLGIYEQRLRWFRDAKNWTWGLHGLEAIIPDARGENMLYSILTPYIRKRWYLDEEIPYFCITYALGFGFYPSLYLNTSLSADLGSIGGLNLRAYLGLAAGYNSVNSPQISNNDFVSESTFPVIPYFGFGVSVLDFINLPRELYVEWKDHEHSSWNVGLVQGGIIISTAERSFLAGSDKKSLISGYYLKFANANVALPWLDHKLYLGTSLINVMAVGQNELGIGILPLRAGYVHTLLEDELAIEPFIEYNYLPSSFVHLGGKLNLKTGSSTSVYLTAGFVSGTPSSALEDFADLSFSRVYIGLGIGLFDYIFYPEQLRYNKKK